MTTHPVVSREEWLEARKAHLVREKELTRQMDALYEERRALPWVKLETDYAFDTPAGRKSLANLFQGKSQLIVYHFMLGPDWAEGCPGCSFIGDHVDGARLHFEQTDVKFWAVSRAPLAKIEAFKKRMGWTFDWASSFGSGFNYDFHVSFTPEQIAAGDTVYNFEPTPHKEEETHGLSVFVNDGGAVYHTYSTYSRGCNILLGAHHFLDMTPKGRNEESTMSWVRLHDKYENAPAAGCPACAAQA